MSTENPTIPVVVTNEVFNKSESAGFEKQGELFTERVLQNIPYDELKKAYDEIMSAVGEMVAQQQEHIVVEKITISLEFAASAETFKLGLSTSAGMSVELKPK
jgi:hypothetical protein